MPWQGWRGPADQEGPWLCESPLRFYRVSGPVLVTIEYSVITEQESKFVRAMRQYARVRRRDGAYRWGIYRDTEVPNRFVEAFLVHSWAEHLRQHERQTKADRELEQHVYSYVAGDPTVRHLLSANSTEL